MRQQYNNETGVSSQAPRTDGRVRQRERTRKAILDAATEIMRKGWTVPSVAEAAEAAQVSRATAYRYFPSEAALVWAAVDRLLPGNPEEVYETSDVLERADALAQVTASAVKKQELMLRHVLRLSMEQWIRRQSGDSPDEPPVRRGGRKKMIAAALEPLRDGLDPADYDRVAAALAMVIGIEARVVLRDICELGDEEVEDVMSWACTSLVRAALDQR